MDITKAFFRYLRGELLNGFYIRKLNLVADKLFSISSLKAELLYWMNIQFNSGNPLYVMRDKDIEGIARVAGILSIRALTDFLIGWARLSESHIVGGKERSERGLLRQATGELEYVRTDQDSYPTDISILATDELRMSLIPADAVPVGYVWGDSAGVILETGMVNGDLLHPTPQTGYEFNSTTNKWEWHGAGDAPIYAPWYGDRYLPLTSTSFMQVTLPDTMLTYLLQTQQMIKYNGLGLIYLLQATTEIIPDLITDLKLELVENLSSHVWYYKMTFTRNEYNFSVLNGFVRFAAWAYFIQSKYPFIQFNNTGE